MKDKILKGLLSTTCSLHFLKRLLGGCQWRHNNQWHKIQFLKREKIKHIANKIQNTQMWTFRWKVRGFKTQCAIGIQLMKRFIQYDSCFWCQNCTSWYHNLIFRGTISFLHSKNFTIPLEIICTCSNRPSVLDTNFCFWAWWQSFERNQQKKMKKTRKN